MTRSIDAYNDEERVHRYEKEMDLMHPNRHKMVDIALEVLPHASDATLVGLDLGIGTGFFTSKFLSRFPTATIIGVDGSDAMLRLAATRLKDHRDQVRFVAAAFENVAPEIADKKFDVVFSSYALHHLDFATKKNVLTAVMTQVKAGGWLLNADLVSNKNADIEKIIQSIRARGIRSRSAGEDPRFADVASVCAFLKGLEKTEGDQPLTINEDLDVLRACGIENATVFWQEYRETVMGGCKSG